MRGLVLEGGGAKGSFHIGVLTALFERGYTFNGIAGTSIGAINGAIVAQGDFPKLYDLWYSATPSLLFDFEEDMVDRILDKEYDKSVFKYVLKTLKSLISSKGVSLDKARDLVDKWVDEEKLRKSPVDFCLVTVSQTDDWVPLELFKEDLPQGEIKDYILASAYLPIFNRPTIGGRMFMDGGMYDNCPINPLVHRGYDEIIAIKVGARMPSKIVIDGTVKVHVIEPSEPLGKLLDFRTETIRRNIKLGYYDGLRFLDNLIGTKFYIKRLSQKEFINFTENLNYYVFSGWAKILGVNGNKQNIYSKLIESVTEDLELPWNLEKEEVFIAMIEEFAKEFGVEKFEIYDIDTFIKKTKSVWKWSYDGKYRLSYSLVSMLLEHYEE